MYILIQYTWATRSAFQICLCDHIYLWSILSQSRVCVTIVTLPKSDFEHTYKPMRRGQARSYLVRASLTALFTDTHTNKYDLKVRHSSLLTLTNSFTLRVRKYRISRVGFKKHMETVHWQFASILHFPINLSTFGGIGHIIRRIVVYRLHYY